MHKWIRAAIIILALSVVPAGAAVGPYQLGAIDGPPGITGADGVSYTTTLRGARTILAASDSDGQVLRHVVLAGKWGIPVVTVGGTTGGLSHDHTTLVLGTPSFRPGVLRKTSRFAVVDTRTLSVKQTITLHGDFGYDTLAPHAATLYLIQHLSQANPERYQVRAYDLRAGRLESQVIADKVENEWVMSGAPAARATSADGRWVFTLYNQSAGDPFVHALDTIDGVARCVDVPWPDSAVIGGAATARLNLSGGGRRLSILGGDGQVKPLVMNTTTFRFEA